MLQENGQNLTSLTMKDIHADMGAILLDESSDLSKGQKWVAESRNGRKSL